MAEESIAAGGVAENTSQQRSARVFLNTIRHVDCRHFGSGKDEMCGIWLRHNCHPIVKMTLKKELVIYEPSIGLILVVGVVSGGDMKERAVMATSGIDSATRGETFVATRMDINYMSKRKVFNGPDPIHNRRAGNSRQPPGKA